MKKSLNKIVVEIKKRKRKIVIFCVVAVALFSFLKIATVAYDAIERKLNLYIVSEQEESLEKINIAIYETEEILSDLDIKLDEIKDFEKLYLSNQESDELLKMLSSLEAKSLRIENALNHYHEDLSIGMYKNRDKVIEAKIDSLWGVHIEINRLVRNIESIAFADRIYKYQIGISQKNIDGILDKFEEMKSL